MRNLPEFSLWGMICMRFTLIFSNVWVCFCTITHLYPPSLSPFYCLLALFLWLYLGMIYYVSHFGATNQSAKNRLWNQTNKINFIWKSLRWRAKDFQHLENGAGVFRKRQENIQKLHICNNVMREIWEAAFALCGHCRYKAPLLFLTKFLISFTRVSSFWQR